TTMPLVRYLLEDEVIVTSSSYGCPCGSKHPTIQVLGRSSSQVILGNHRFFPVDVENVVYRAGFDYRLIYWKGYVDSGNLEVDFTCEKDFLQCGKAIEDEFRKKYNVSVKAHSVDIENFISSSEL